MVKLSNQERLKPWMGVILFVIGVVFLIFPGSLMQIKWGMGGLIATEFGFLGIAILYCVIRKVSIKEVFPVKKITARDLFGTLFMFAGGFLLNLITIGFSMLILNFIGLGDSLNEAAALSDFLYGSKSLYIVIMLVAAVLPAICEEAFMRGAVLSSFRSLGKDWVIVLIIGAMFGILHLSPLRFLNTACLGAVLAFIMVKKNNIILPMIVHLLNNLISTLVGFFGTNSGAGEAVTGSLEGLNYTSLLGSYLTMGFLCPIFFVLGAMLLDREHHRPRRFLIAGIISAVLLFGGIALSSASALSGGSIFGDTLLNWNYSHVVTEEDVQCPNLAEAGIEITEERNYMVVVSANAVGGEITFTMTDENGEEVFSKTSSNMLIVSEYITLKPGHYTLEFTGGDDLVGKTFAYDVIVK